VIALPSLAASNLKSVKFHRHSSSHEAKTTYDPVLQRLYLDGPIPVYIRRSDIKALKEGCARPEISKLYPYIFPHVLKLSGEFNKESLSHFSSIRRHNMVRAIVDENLCGRGLIPHVWDLLGETVHVSRFGYKGRLDHEIIKYARENGYNAILTKDKAMWSEEDDLTAIALRHFRETRSSHERRIRNNFPMIVQFDVGGRKSEDITRLFRVHSHRVGQEVINRNTPFVRLSFEHGFEDGRSLVSPLDLFPSAEPAFAA